MITNILQNEYFIVDYYNSHKTLMYKFLKFVPSQIYKESMLTMRDYFIKNRLRKLMPVLANAQVVNPEDQKWFTDEIIPKMAQSGLKYVAIIPPNTVFGTVSSENIIRTLENSNDGVIRKVFKSESEGLTWLDTF